MDEEAVREEVFSTSSLVELLIHDGITIYLTERVSIAILTPL